MVRHPKSFRLSTEACRFLSELATIRGQSQQAVLERAIREDYARELKTRLETELLSHKETIKCR